MGTNYGGKRIGAGRPLGALTVRTRAVAEAMAKGITPLEVMISNMRHFHRLAESAEAALAEMSAERIAGMSPDEQFKHLLAQVKRAAGLRELAQACARDAAPYMHARLATIEHTGEVEVTPVVRLPEVSKNTGEWQKQHVPQQVPPKKLQ
jgi:hypothetical protein